MKILLQNIATPFWVEDEEIIKAALDKVMRAGLKAQSETARIYKRSFDARKKTEIKTVCSVGVELCGSPSKEKLTAIGAVKLENEGISPVFGNERLAERPLVVGMGPAGLFCALLLAENGYRPIIIDRGPSVEERVRCVDRFYKERELDTEANIQFGAGGAGTFSDGKLVTRINDSKCNYVLERLCEFGAPEEILVKAKPHIGTDKLRGVVDSVLAKIAELGGEVIYRCRMDGFERMPDQSFKVKTTKGDINCGAVILAVGHSARDTVTKLIPLGLAVEPKAFSVGVRIEHLKSDIDRGLYGEFAGHPKLSAGEYNLSDTKGGRGVYTFCMCPGGEVVAAASECGGVVVNGMSAFARDGRNSNSALAVTVNREDYGGTVEKAMAYQRELERKAFVAGGGNYNAPIQTVGDFMSGRLSAEPKRIMPTYMGGDHFTLARLDELLPCYVTEALRRGIGLFGKRIKGFDACDAVLSGVETRTSSPVRMPRTDAMIGEGLDGVYPCGEGAGYAGGITSAAVDGIKTALEIMKRYAPIE